MVDGFVLLVEVEGVQVFSRERPAAPLPVLPRFRRVKARPRSEAVPAVVETIGEALS